MINNINYLLEKVKNLYTKGLEEYGFNSKAVGWKSKEHQYLRFLKLLSVIENKNDKFSIIDYGCGYAELLVYLIDNGYNVSKYIGYDISFFILEKAKIYLDQNNINSNIFDFILSDKINSFVDFIVVSRTFNVKFDFDDNLYLKYILKKLDMINHFSKKGFSFNMLSTYVDYKENHLFYGDPLFFFDYCKKNYSKYVSLLHDYPLWEFTIIVKK